MLGLAFAGNQDGLIMRADGKGYYGYLPAVFIYQDPEYKFIDTYEARYYPKEMYADFTNTLPDGQKVNKYFIGVALLQLPFFLIAHLLSILFGLPADGYAPLYQFTFMAGGIVYVYLGFRALKAVLEYFGGTRLQHYAAIALLLAGTNLWHYALYEQCMSHIYSLAATSFFFLSLLRIFRSHDRNWIPVAGLCLGLIVAIRPINILVLGIIPIAAGSWQALKEGIGFIFREYRILLWSILLCALPGLFQMAAWFWQTGSPIVYSYAEEGFDFSAPRMYHILFSYRKGWFLWTPMVVIGLLGYVVWLRKRRLETIWVMLFLLFTVYVLSCWHTWTYGMSFGSRPFIEYLFLLPPGLLLLWTRSRWALWRVPIAMVSILLVFVNLVQAYQYKADIILMDGMTKKDYWKVFLKTGEEYRGILWKLPPAGDTLLVSGETSLVVYNDFENGDRWDNSTKLSDSARNGSKAAVVDPLTEYSSSFILPLTDEILSKDSLLEATVWFRGGEDAEESTLATVIFRDNKNIVWQDRRLNTFSLKRPGWHRAVLKYRLEKEKLKQGDELRVFVWNRDKLADMAIDDFRIRLIRFAGNPVVSEEARRK